MYKINVIESFAGAHRLEGYEGACRNLHGHNWRVRVQLVSETTDKLGMALDFGVVKKHLRALIERLDHQYLNELEWFQGQNPTSENIARVIYREMGKVLKTPDARRQTPEQTRQALSLLEGGIKVSEVEVWESDTTSIIYSEL